MDSRTILDEQGAELLLGKGDMLAKMNGSNETLRVQCPFISEEEVSAITDHLRRQGTPVYHDDILRADDDDEESSAEDEPLDPRFDEAWAYARVRKASGKSSELSDDIEAQIARQSATS